MSDTHFVQYKATFNPIREDEKIIYTKIAGVTYDDCPVNILSCENGDLLDLIREPDNHFDKNAIRVEKAGKKLGYISRELALELAFYMDSGNDILCCQIEQITGGGNKNVGVNISIAITDKKQSAHLYEYDLFDMDAIIENVHHLIDNNKTS